MKSIRSFEILARLLDGRPGTIRQPEAVAIPGYRTLARLGILRDTGDLAEYQGIQAAPEASKAEPGDFGLFTLDKRTVYGLVIDVDNGVARILTDAPRVSESHKSIGIGRCPFDDSHAPAVAFYLDTPRRGVVVADVDRVARIIGSVNFIVDPDISLIWDFPLDA